ncbi:MAG: P83/100 family protein [Treponema sp.]
MKANKFAILPLALFFLASNIHALNVDENELRSIENDDETIVFINYTGPYSKIDSLESIKRIGTNLGSPITSSLNRMITVGSPARYSVIHAVNANETKGFDADILLIGSAASVDHIDNLRHIIASYLSAAYGYTEKDANTIAIFVTVYNAVYKGKIDSYNSKYKKIVTDNLDPVNCGLSVDYKDWSGKSQIVIPLFDAQNGGLSTVETSVISDNEVVKHMQAESDKGISTRKDMVDLKEREAEQASERAQESQKNAVIEQKKADDERRQNDLLRQQAETAQREAEAANKKAAENPNDGQAQINAKNSEEKARQKQNELTEHEKALAEQEEKAQKAQQEAAYTQAIADKKTSEAQEERKVIAGDQQSVIEQAIKDSSAPSAYGLELTNESSMLSGIIKINTKTGAVIKASPVAYIRNRTMFSAGQNFIAVAGENSGNGAVKLVLLSPDSMEIVKESAETVAEDSVLIQDNGEFYCIIQDGRNWVLAKYDSDLTLKLKSSVPVKRTTPITASDSYIIVTGANGQPRLLNKSNLNTVVSSGFGNADAK